ncbi:MAG TPA: N-6 DNA methylase [Pyrinomonadaceae bacterium]|nr:N-6 DNA methylase [Pyrinomonadaceae bacterium]
MPEFKIDSIFRDASIRHSLEIFSDADIDAFEATIFDKNGKPYVKCLASGKDRMAKPEEIVRQLWLRRLLDRYKYPSSRLAVEFPVTFGRDTSKRADIVVFDTDRPNVPYIIIEVKQTKLKDGKDQLKSYCHATGAPIGVWSDGAQAYVYHRRNPNHFIELPDLPAATETIEEILAQPWTLETLIAKEQARERTKSLKDIIREMEDEVLANAGVDVFEEVFKLIFTKLYDELSVFRGKYQYLRFRNTNTETDVRNRMSELFSEAREEWEGVFPADDRIKLTGSHLVVCVSYLEEYKLFNSNLDVVDDAFEYLINQTSKGEKGQYFTPRWVIDMCVKMLNPKEHETLIDTACGSAGFTVHSFFKVWRDIIRDEGLDVSHLFTVERKPQRCIDYVRNKVFAIDFDEKAVRVARCLNLIAGDGQTNVLHLNTLDWQRWDETMKSEEWTDTYNEGWKKLKRLLRNRKDFRQFDFDILMANPPFAGDIKQSDMLAPYDLAQKANGKPESKVGRDLLFIERNLDFLKPGGRMAVVLPQGRFNNSSDKRVREFIAERCRILAVVGLEGNTFKPHTGTKTSVLFVQKWNDDKTLGDYCPRVDDYNIFFATQRMPSKDSSGEKIYRRRKIVRHFVGEIGSGELTDYDEAEFLELYGSLKKATLYQVLFRDERQIIRNLEEIEAEYGSLDDLESQCKKVLNLRKPIPTTKLVLDPHGHIFVQHDLFNHEGVTEDGIAEAFAEFAKKEKLSFF